MNTRDDTLSQEEIDTLLSGADDIHINKPIDPKAITKYVIDEFNHRCDEMMMLIPRLDEYSRERLLDHIAMWLRLRDYLSRHVIVIDADELRKKGEAIRL